MTYKNITITKKDGSTISLNNVKNFITTISRIYVDDFSCSWEEVKKIEVKVYE